MHTRKIITNERFTVRLCHIAEGLGFKRVGPFERLLKGMNPNTLIGIGYARVRVYRLLREIETWKETGAD